MTFGLWPSVRALACSPKRSPARPGIFWACNVSERTLSQPKMPKMSKTDLKPAKAVFKVYPRLTPRQEPKTALSRFWPALGPFSGRRRSHLRPRMCGRACRRAGRRTCTRPRKLFYPFTKPQTPKNKNQLFSKFRFQFFRLCVFGRVGWSTPFRRVRWLTPFRRVRWSTLFQRVSWPGVEQYPGHHKRYARPGCGK